MIVNVYKITNNSSIITFKELLELFENIPDYLDIDNNNKLFCINAIINVINITNKYNFACNIEYTFDADDNKYNNNYKLIIDKLSIINPYRLLLKI